MREAVGDLEELVLDNFVPLPETVEFFAFGRSHVVIQATSRGRIMTGEGCWVFDWSPEFLNLPHVQIGVPEAGYLDRKFCVDSQRECLGIFDYGCDGHGNAP